MCAKCSNQKFPLPYEDGKLCRVCRGCFHQLIVNQRGSSSSSGRNGHLSDSSAEDLSTAAMAAAEKQLTNGVTTNGVTNGHQNGHQNGVEEEEDLDGRPRGLLEVKIAFFTKGELIVCWNVGYHIAEVFPAAPQPEAGQTS